MYFWQKYKFPSNLIQLFLIEVQISIQPNTNLKLKLAHINKVIEAEMSVVIEVVERIKMEVWVFKCFFGVHRLFGLCLAHIVKQ